MVNYSPFYDSNKKNLFNNLYLPLFIDNPDLSFKCINGISNNEHIKSYSLTNCKIKFPYKIIKNENKKNNFYKSDIMVSRKIRIFPSDKQINIFNKCFGATRFIYNQTLASIKVLYEICTQDFNRKRKYGCIHLIKTKVNSINKYGSKTCKEKIKQCCNKLSTKYFCSKHFNQKLKYDIPLNFQYWRKEMVTNNSDLVESEKWMIDVPHDTRQLAVKKLMDNYNVAIKNLKNGNIKSFDLNFKSKKDKRQYLFVDHRSVKKNGFIWKRKFDHPLKMKKNDKKWLNKHMKKNKLKQMIITRDYPGKYYLHIPFVKSKEKIKPGRSIVSIDPGVRSFHAFYDPEGIHGEIGSGLANKIINIYKNVDKYQSIIDTSKSKYNNHGYEQNKKNRQRIRKKCAMLRAKAKHIVDDYHWKAISYYCHNYQNIVIPKLDTDSLKRKIKRDNLPTSKEMIRKMMVLAHGRFIERLKFKAIIYGTNVLIADEHYTSKTCGKCGIMKENLGSLKIFSCKECKTIIDRDINGARNILIKNIKKQGKDEISLVI